MVVEVSDLLFVLQLSYFMLANSYFLPDMSPFQAQHPRFCPPAPYLFKGGSKPSRKLDSRFIMDVNVLDGTMVAPSTPFSKIWRMRNSGSLEWPRGTQLVWIGGDKFSDAVSVEIEVLSFKLVLVLNFY